MKQSENLTLPDTSSHLFTYYHRAYARTNPPITRININESFDAEPIEIQVERMMNNGEPIGAATPQIYTDRMEGVRPEYDIRADHFEMALDATELAARNQLIRREEFHKKLTEENKGNTAKGGDSPKTP